MQSSVTILWNTLSAQAWEAALLRADYSAYQQHWAYGAIMSQAKSGSVARAAIMREGELIGVAQLQVRRFFRFYNLGLILRGPVWLDDTVSEEGREAITAQLLREAPLKRPQTTLIMPESAAVLSRAFIRVVTGYSTVMLDLRQGEATLLAAQEGKWRNRLRAAEKSGLCVRELNVVEEDYSWLLAHEAEQSRRIGYSALSPALVPLWQMQMGEAGLLIMQAFAPDAASENDQTCPCAAMLFLVHGNAATYHIGWANTHAKKSNAHNLLLWEAIKILKLRGIHTLDLGGVNTQDAAGIARFKLGAGGALVRLGGTFAAR